MATDIHDQRPLCVPMMTALCLPDSADRTTITTATGLSPADSREDALHGAVGDDSALGPPWSNYFHPNPTLGGYRAPIVGGAMTGTTDRLDLFGLPSFS
jgi:hypothetical protein